MIALGSTILAAILFRVRGGMWFGDSPHWFTRGMWSVGMGVIVFLSSLNMKAGVYVMPAFFVGTVLPWWGTIDLGRIEGRKDRDYALNSLRGLCFTLPAGAVLWWLGLPWYAGLVGLLCPICYEAGWRINSQIKDLRQGPELGELIFGALVGLSFCIGFQVF